MDTNAGYLSRFESLARTYHFGSYDADTVASLATQ